MGADRGDVVAELQLRLGVSLSPSHRRFLLADETVGVVPPQRVHGAPRDARRVAWSYDAGEPGDRPPPLRFTLDAGRDGEGRRILLDPLATGRDGEWEAWASEAGVRRGGTWTAYASFGALLTGAGGTVRSWPPDDRTLAALVRNAADATAPTQSRVRALRLLGGTLDPTYVPLLVAAAADPRTSVRGAVLPWLAISEVPRARQTAVTMLVRSGIEGSVIRAARGPAAWALADAWNLARDPRLLVQLAACGDARAVAGVTEAVADPATPGSVRAGLVRYAASPGDRAVVPALLAAAGMPGAPATAVAAALRRLEPPALHPAGGSSVP